MLVLSRRPHEKIVFPQLGITIEVIRIGGKAVRIGVDAPRDVLIAREEISDSLELPPGAPQLGTPQLGTPQLGTPQLGASQLGRNLRHTLRNRLNTASLGLQVLHSRLEAGDTDDLESLIFKVFNELHEVDAELDSEEKEELPETDGRHRRALIIEDNANERQLLAEYLRISGYDVEVVKNGQEAISYLKERAHPDVVLLDMCMPQLDGSQTIRSIRRQPELRDLKVFAVSGASRREMGVEVGARGVDRWFSKPVDARTLVSEMNRELDAVRMPA